jgi:Arrestin (or S-antigen), N-terminal domain
LELERPAKTQYVILKLTGTASVTLQSNKFESVFLEEGIVLWGAKSQIQAHDKTHSSDSTSLENDTPKKQKEHKEEWETGLMDEGQHSFAFEFDLPPKSLPSSVQVKRTAVLADNSSAKDQLLTPSPVFTNDHPPSSAP